MYARKVTIPIITHTTLVILYPSLLITQAPPPSVQRCFSASATQEKGAVMRGLLRVVGSEGGFRGGLQVAIVKVSTSLRMKKRGKVPPRLEALNMLV